MFRPSESVFCVSTHSRPKAAGTANGAFFSTAMFQHTAARRRLGIKIGVIIFNRFVSTHSRPKAAGAATEKAAYGQSVSTHSRPKAAGSLPILCGRRNKVSTHSRPKAAGPSDWFAIQEVKFQHTAARRRLVGGVAA